MELYLQIFFSTLALSFGILHLILFVYNRSFKSNLFFSIFLFLYALNIFFDYQSSLVDSQIEHLMYLRLHRAVMPYNSIFILLFIYYAFEMKIPRYFWVLTAALVVTGFMAVLEPVRNFTYVQIPLILVGIEAVRIFVSLIKQEKQDAWIIAGGFILLFLFSSYDLFMDLNVIPSVAGIRNGYPFGFLFLIVFASIYLARDFARVNRTLLVKERETREMEIAKKLVEAEDRRKQQELDEARSVQLSLLPQCITGLNQYDFCFEMRPATEVGGDYYDYVMSENGAITLAIGDATNHGMKAGIMVSIMKSLFLTQMNGMEFSEFLNSCSQTIREMNLKNLYMALMLVRLEGGHLKMSSAGIPPLLIYRRDTETVEQIRIKGMPLGAVDHFPYETAETELNPGDTVLLMTDGLSELFNSERESFGSERVRKIFLDNAEKSVDEIVNRLIESGEKWMAGKKQDDDITFISFRYNG